MIDNVVPGRAGGKQPLSRRRLDDAVAGRLVRVVLQQVRVEVGGVVLHGARGRGRGCGGQGAACATRAGAIMVVLLDGGGGGVCLQA